MKNELSNMERETHLNLVADDRGTWHVYTDDPVMIARLDKIAVATRITDLGKYYELSKGQVTLRKKIVMTDEQRRAAAERLRSLRGQQGAARRASESNLAQCAEMERE